MSSPGFHWSSTWIRPAFAICCFQSPVSKPLQSGIQIQLSYADRIVRVGKEMVDGKAGFDLKLTVVRDSTQMARRTFMLLPESPN